MLEQLPAAGGAMDDRRVYLPLQSGTLVAVDRETGEQVWLRQAPSLWAPVLNAGRMFVADREIIRALDAITGAEIWSALLPSPMSAPLIVDAGRLIAPLDSGELLGLYASNGAIAWQRGLPAPCRQTPSSADGALIVCALADSRVIAVDRDSGRTRWERMLEGTLSAPLAARDRVFVGSTTNVFWALDPERGSELWRWPAGGDVIGAAADGDVIYFASLDNILRAVNRSNGNQRWKKTIPTRPAAPPIAFNGIVLLTGVAPRVDGYLGKTGTVQGTHMASSDLQGVPMLDQVLKPYRVAMVTLTRDGRVTALRPEPMMMRDPLLVPLTELPGRRVDRERLR